VLEALAAGVPVVASPIAPVLEIARQARGIAVADPARPAEFADAIDTVLHTPPPTHLPAVFTAETSLQRWLACYA
jgi:glycosyltransferase involved in cell wall biosynthesis